MPKSHKPKSARALHAKGTPGVQIPPIMEVELREAVGAAAAETAPRELLEFVGASNGSRAYEIARGMFVAIWDGMNRNGDFVVLRKMAEAIKGVRFG